jgi:hypothetical protein
MASKQLSKPSRKLAVAPRREDGLDAAGLPRNKYEPRPSAQVADAAPPPPPSPERLLSDDDLLRLLEPRWRDSIGLREMHKWLAANTENITRLHTTCGALSTFWEPRKDANGCRVVTLCHFWRYSELVGLAHIAPTAALTREMRPQVQSKLSAAQQTLSISDFCLGLAEIAANRCTCLLALKHFGIGSSEDKLGDRLDALLKGMTNAMGSILGAGEPLASEGAASLFRHELSGGVQRLLEVMCDEDGTLPLSEARKLLLCADTLKPAGTRNVRSVAIAPAPRLVNSPRALATAALARARERTRQPGPPPRSLLTVCPSRSIHAGRFDGPGVGRQHDSRASRAAAQ